MNIDNLIESFTEYEFGAVCSTINWLNESTHTSNLEQRMKQLNEILLKHAEDFLNGNETQIGN